MKFETKTTAFGFRRSLHTIIHQNTFEYWLSRRSGCHSISYSALLPHSTLFNTNLPHSPLFNTNLPHSIQFNTILPPSSHEFSILRIRLPTAKLETSINSFLLLMALVHQNQLNSQPQLNRFSEKFNDEHSIGVCCVLFEFLCFYINISTLNIGALERIEKMNKYFFSKQQILDCTNQILGK